MAKIVNKTKVITGPRTRWSYANVWDPKSINGGTPKYSVSLIIPKSDKKTVEAIKAAIQAAYEEGESKLKGNGKTVPALSVIKTPLRDGDVERPDDPVYADAYFINANSATAPGIVDADLNPILERSEVYSGVYGRASISFYGRLWRHLAVAAIDAVVLLAIDHYLGISGFLPLVAVSLFCLAMHFGLSALFREFTRSDAAFFKDALDPKKLSSSMREEMQ